MKKRQIKRQNQKALTILPIILSVISFLSLFYIIFFVSPQIWQEIYLLPFFVVLFLFFASLGLIFLKKILPSIIVGLAAVAILFLRLINIKDFVNPILIICLSATLIYFFTSDKLDDKLKTNSINQSGEK